MQKKLTYKEIIEIAVKYETVHPVDEYQFFDWNVWPLIRTDTILSALLAPRFQQQPTIKNFLKRSQLLKYAVQTFKSRLKVHERVKLWKLDPEHNDNHLATDRDVVFLTLSQRRISFDQGLYEIYTDPLVEILNKLEVSTLVWEAGEERTPRYHPSAWVSRLIQKELKIAPELPSLPEPAWYVDFAPFAATIRGLQVPWTEVANRILYVQKLSIIYERWLKHVNPRLLIIVCWYGLEEMAATLAARRLGIKSADLQHGIQGECHHAYSGWSKIPRTRYELVPDIFLNWGINQAQELLELNPSLAQHTKALTIGNLWLNKCRYSDCNFMYNDQSILHELVATHTKTILVTLQHGDESSDFIINALRQSPDDWLWLLRFHPNTPQLERVHVENKLRSLSCHNYEFKVSSRMAVYALMRICNVHVTGYSTTALEALAFGLPTVLVTPTGSSIYNDLIAKCTMFYAQNIEELFQILARCEDVSAQQCEKSAQGYFASRDVAMEGIRRLLSITGIDYVDN